MDQPARDRGPTYPATSGVDVDESFKRFLSDFYAVSDDADALARWLDSFSDDAIVLMGKDRAEGKSELEALRRSMWTKVAHRRHKVVKIFPANFDTSSSGHGADSPERLEFMLFGTADYVLHSGLQQSVDWAAHGIVARGTQADRWKFTFYRVYLQQRHGTDATEDVEKPSQSH